MLAPAQNGAFLIGFNETLNRTTAADLTDTFVRASASRQIGVSNDRPFAPGESRSYLPPIPYADRSAM
jgi:hypothetical protein